MTFTLPLPPTPTLETERLVLRPLRLDDAPTIQALFPRWEIVRYLAAAVPWPFPDDGAETHVRESLLNMERGERLYWAITPKGGDDGLIGRIDLRPDGGARDMRGFWLAVEHWGRGLMTEAAEAVTAHAFRELGWPYLDVNNAICNAASRRVKEKQGFALIGMVEDDFVEGRQSKEVWRLTREVWAARWGAG
jgi:RimJ/RimL family protein N-acetyltransferase